MLEELLVDLRPRGDLACCLERLALGAVHLALHVEQPGVNFHPHHVYDQIGVVCIVEILFKEFQSRFSNFLCLFFHLNLFVVDPFALVGIEL